MVLKKSWNAGINNEGDFASMGIKLSKCMNNVEYTSQNVPSIIRTKQQTVENVSFARNRSGVNKPF